MSVLVDSSVWIEYFRSTDKAKTLAYLIDEDLVVVNDLILAEIIPALRLHSKFKHVRLMQMIDRPQLEIKWTKLMDMQVLCLRKGINKVGISDLIIAQHAIQNDFELYSLDKRFKLLARFIPLKLFRHMDDPVFPPL
ncbi:MAG: PIN domain-containing protein [Kiritimatiellae bacterium]|nr:PIN domain-containing protein [Kiritimatiellia bacterium]